ncbi:MAG: CDP-alcohol phosphatidyltransferase family protein [Erysipelotrichaceae bacterium]|nr:CDP-alcohol phosphatidyltransferase family protein [Erysipelotrichaceae bacterium]
MLIQNLANLITGSRIIATTALIFLEVLSKPFMFVYVWCGLSDVLDGFVARKTKTVSSFGSKLDTVSDLFFYTVMMLKVWPYLKKYLPGYVWILIYVVVAFRALLYILVGIGKKTLISRHTYLNKATGLLMFFLPFMVRNSYLVAYSLLILTVAYISSVNESFYVFRKKGQG